MGRANKGTGVAQVFGGRGRAQGGNVRRKRKTKYIWLPTLGAEIINAVDLTESNGFPFSCTGGPNSQLPAAFALFPLLEDTPQEVAVTANPDPNIADFIGTDYVIKRIVGKCNIVAFQSAADTPPTLAVTAGMFVARADDTNALNPIGAATTPQALPNYDPNYVDNIREPWIWRRTWLVSNAASTNAATNAYRSTITTNVQYGSIQDGPHIDAKTGRRVRNDERLWFAASARPVTTDGTEFSALPGAVGTVNGYLDIRVLGALRRARNRSNF